MTAHIKTTTATEVEAAALALVQRLGVHAPVEIVNWEDAFRSPPSAPVVRIGQVGETAVSVGIPGPRGRAAGLDVADIKAVSYGTGLPNFGNALIRTGWADVHERFRDVLDGVDVCELTIGKAVGGRVGAFTARGVQVELGILPAVPVLGPDVRSMAVSITGELALRNRGELVVNSELVDVTSTDSEPDEDGQVQRQAQVTAAIWPVNRTHGPRLPLGQAWERAQQVLQGLEGRGFVQAGRITAVDVQSAPSEDGGAIEARVGLTLRGRIGGAR